jgi:hypothetical protein
MKQKEIKTIIKTLFVTLILFQQLLHGIKKKKNDRNRVAHFCINSG